MKKGLLIKAEKRENGNIPFVNGPHSAVGKVSGYRCQADCRSRGPEFDPGLVPHYCGD